MTWRTPLSWPPGKRTKLNESKVKPGSDQESGCWQASDATISLYNSTADFLAPYGPCCRTRSATPNYIFSFDQRNGRRTKSFPVSPSIIFLSHTGGCPSSVANFTSKPAFLKAAYGTAVSVLGVGNVM